MPPRERSAWRAASRRDGRGTSSSRARHDAPARRAARRRPRGPPSRSRSTTPRRRGWRGSLSRHSAPRCPGTRRPSRGAGRRPASTRPPTALRAGAPASRQCRDHRRRRGRGSSGPAAGSACAGRSRGLRSDAPSNLCSADPGLPAAPSAAAGPDWQVWAGVVRRPVLLRCPPARHRRCLGAAATSPAWPGRGTRCPCRPASDSHGGARRPPARGSDAPGRAPRGRSRSDSPVRTPRY